MKSKILLILAPLVVFGVLSTACRNSSENQIAAESAVLSRSDFPLGWTSIQPEDIDDLGWSEECRIPEPLGQTAEAISDYFIGPDGQVVNNGVQVYVSAEASRAELNARVERLDRCNNELEQLMSEAFTARGGVKHTVTTVKYSFPRIGASSSAWRTVIVTHTSPPLTVVLDALSISIGRMGGTFVYSSDGTPNSDEELEYARVFFLKLKNAGEMLSD